MAGLNQMPFLPEPTLMMAAFYRNSFGVSPVLLRFLDPKAYFAKQDPGALAAVAYSYADQTASKKEVAAIRAPFVSTIGAADFQIDEVNNLKRAMPTLKVITIEGATHGGPRGIGRHPKFIGSLDEFLKVNSLKK